MDLLLLIVQIALIVFTFFYTVLLLVKIKRVNDKESKLDQEFTKRLYRTNVKAQQIMQNAIFKSKEILQNTKTFRKEIENEASQNMNKSYQDYVNSLEDHSADILKKYEDLFSELDKDLKSQESSAVDLIEQSASKNLEKISQQMIENNKKFEVNLQQKIDAEFETAKQEVAKYKEERISSLDKDIQTVASNIATKLIGKSLSMDDNKQFIFDALEKAKKERLFDNL